MRPSTFIVGLIMLAACADDDIRGRSTPSSDGRTYLIIADDNGGKCGPMLVDGKRWGTQSMKRAKYGRASTSSRVARRCRCTSIRARRIASITGAREPEPLARAV